MIGIGGVELGTSEVFLQEFDRDLLEVGSLGVGLGILDVLEEEVAESQSQA